MTDEQYEDLKADLKEMRDEMKPVIDTFNALRSVGKWTGVFVAFVGSITAVALGLKELFKR